MSNNEMFRKLTKKEMQRVFGEGRCPFCDEEPGFYMGPSGGMMRNIRFECGGEVNVTDPECWGMNVPLIGQILTAPAGYEPEPDDPDPTEEVKEVKKKVSFLEMVRNTFPKW